MEKLICVVLVLEQNFNNLEGSNTFISSIKPNTPILQYSIIPIFFTLFQLGRSKAEVSS